MTNEEWFTLDSIEEIESDETLYCIAVDSPDKQFLIGKIAVPTHNTDAGKADDELKGEAAMILGSIARLGRAAGVHLVIATQRPDAKLIAGETKANLGVRINCGRTDSTASSMILDSSEGVRVKANPKGRLYVKIYGEGDHAQGFFANPDWIDNWLANKGLNPDGTPLSNKQSRLANIVDMDEFDGSDLDTKTGVDNHSVVEQIREEEAAENNSDEPIEFDDETNDLISELESESTASDDDSDFSLDDDNDTVDTEAAAQAPSKPRPQVSGVEMPDLNGGGKSKDDKFSRPEDDWDDDLEALIDENFD